jgi:hypothetical protein
MNAQLMVARNHTFSEPSKRSIVMKMEESGNTQCRDRNAVPGYQEKLSVSSKL